MTDARARWGPALDRAAAFLAVFAFLLRLWTGGAGTGTGLFLDLLVWVALAFWFGGRALAGGASWRFTGAEFALLAFSIAALASALRSDGGAAALEQAFRLLSFGLLFCLALQALGARELLEIFLASLAALAAWGLFQGAVLLPDALRLVPPGSLGELGEEFGRRARTGEIFSTFIGPNQLAGFLALVLPPAAGFLWDARRDGRRRAAAGAGGILALGGAALLMTGSLGGWIALGAGAAAFAALALTRARGRRLALGAGAALAGAAVLLVLLSPLLETLARKSHSLHVRRVYWQAAGRVAAEAPVLGVGPDAFQEHYFRLKSDVQQETTRVHNDYLQVLADTGIPGLAAFAAFLALALRRALAGAGASGETPPAPAPWLLPAAAAASFLAAVLLSGIFDPLHALGLLAVWLAARLLLRAGGPGGEPVFARIGVAAGLVALLVHMTVDFDLYEPGLGASLFAALALAALLGPPPPRVVLPAGACAGALALLLAVAGPALLLLVPRALAADQEREGARRALALLERSRGPELETTQRISDALRLSRAAQEHNPVDPEAFVLHARARFHEWDLLRGTARDERALAEIEGIALECMEVAQRLRPRMAPYAAERALLHREFRRFHLEEAARPDRRTLALARAGEHLRQALEQQRRAVGLYPTFSRLRYGLGRLLELSGEPGAAAEEYREALRLSDLAGRELEDLRRLKLRPFERARALKRLDRHAEAQEAVRAWLSSTPPDELRRRRGRLASLGLPPDEADEVLRPVIEEAIDAILR